jgi:hypothetical protein
MYSTVPYMGIRLRSDKNRKQISAVRICLSNMQSHHPNTIFSAAQQFK